VKAEWAVWLVPDKLLRKTCFYEKPIEKRQAQKIFGTMRDAWQIGESGFAGPAVWQMVTR